MRYIQQQILLRKTYQRYLTAEQTALGLFRSISDLGSIQTSGKLTSVAPQPVNSRDVVEYHSVK